MQKAIRYILYDMWLNVSLYFKGNIFLSEFWYIIQNIFWDFKIILIVFSSIVDMLFERVMQIDCMSAKVVKLIQPSFYNETILSSWSYMGVGAGPSTTESYILSTDTYQFNLL